MSGSSGWFKVLAGAQLVAQAAAKQASNDATKTSIRIADHAWDLSSKAGTSALSSEQVQALQRNIQSIIMQHYANGAARSNQQYQNRQSPKDDRDNEETMDLKGYDWVNEELDRLKKQKMQANVVSAPQNRIKVAPETENEIALNDVSEFSTPPTDISAMTSRSEDTPTYFEKPTVTQCPDSAHNCNRVKLPVTEALPVSSTQNLVAAENRILPSNDDDDDSAINSTIELGDDSYTRLMEGTPVPSTRFGRAMGFASLGAGLAYGTAMEGISRLVGTTSSSSAASGSMIMNDANSNRLAASLCRMRGAALKMGQMLSIQDDALLPAPLAKALEQVRQGANAMPKYQLFRQLETQLGSNWRDLFVDFDDAPFAAASIGQVHRATIQDGDLLKHVVVKIQYPGVASSIKSDLRNLGMLVKWTGLAPKGLFIENVMRVGEKELRVECDYRREMLNQRRIKSLVENDPVLQANQFVVPDVIMHLTSEQVLTSEYRPGRTIDSVAHLNQDERNRIGRHILFLTMKELFEWRFMQTDPNWGNFLYDAKTQTTSLIDFGATREFSKEFVDGYLRIVWASANQDEEALMKQSRAMSFLTGEESEQMIRAHKLSGYTVGEPFHKDAPFDFRGSNISTRMGEHTSVFLSDRLAPPPEEVYTLHRKLAGAYMLCIKLGAVIRCRDMLEHIVRNHNFEDGPPPKLLIK
ncbi:hypothetical protein MPSEU_000955400 [Mayamaea pseudoterrestris]|nr:hypothetical protein MPSEU_000955400 [Mayamaea pseudoterrestris]